MGIRVHVEHPRVGVAVIIHDDNRLLMALRDKAGKPGHKTWQLPGGHLEMYESFEGCVKRESREEVSEDIELADLWTLEVTNNPWPDQEKHYVTIFQVARYVKGDIGGINGHGPWAWFDMHKLPSPLFESANVLTPTNLLKIMARRH